MPQVNHAQCSLLMPQGYQGQVASSHDPSQQWSIIQAATYYELPAVVDRVGDWAICTDGLYCLTSNYPIQASRLNDSDWVDHMKSKNWVNVSDFTAALERARSLRDMGYIR